MITLDKCFRLIDEGYSLITSDAKKVPNIKWSNSQKNPLTKEQFEKIYNLKSTAFAGLVTGFNDLEVIDIDLKVFSTAREQVDFWHEFISFLKDNIFEFDDKFVIYQTLNSGYHILYKSKRVCGNTKIAKLKGHKEAIIESRGLGGYAIIYEKNVLNKTYKDIKYISDEDRDILWMICKTYNYIDEIIQEEKIHHKDFDKKGISPWEDFNNKTSIFDIIRSDFEIVRQLSDKYIIKRFGAKSTHSGYVYKNSGCMYLFSTGTIYPNEKLISPFTAYAIQKYNSDFSRAAKDLYAKGFGDRIKPKNIDIEKDKIIIKEECLNFPIDIFPQSIQNYLQQCHITLNSSYDYMSCAFLWMVSVTIGNSMIIEVKKGWYETANIWIALVGKAGIGKTPSIQNMTFPLQQKNSFEIKRFVKNLEKYNTYMALDKKEKQLAEEIKKPFKNQFIVNDITLEALIDLHSENKNGVGVLKDELAGWFKEMNRYRQGSDLEHWLSSWSGKEINLNRKTAKSSFVDRAFIPILGGIQPDVMDSFYTDENKENGFIDRMLFSFPNLNVNYYNEAEMNQNLIDWYNDYVSAFYNDIKKIIKYNDDGEIISIKATFTPEAKKEWVRIFNKITKIQNDDSENEYMKSMLPKQKAYIPRFSLLINAIEQYDSYLPNYTQVSKESILKAEKLSEYFVEMAKKIKITSTETTSIKKIIQKNDDKSIFEKFKLIYKNDPDINKTKLSEILGISRVMLYKYIQKYNENKV